MDEDANDTPSPDRSATGPYQFGQTFGRPRKNPYSTEPPPQRGPGRPRKRRMTRRAPSSQAPTSQAPASEASTATPIPLRSRVVVEIPARRTTPTSEQTADEQMAEDQMDDGPGDLGQDPFGQDETGLDQTTASDTAHGPREPPAQPLIGDLPNALLELSKKRFLDRVWEEEQAARNMRKDEMAAYRKTTQSPRFLALVESFSEMASEWNLADEQAVMEEWANSPESMAFQRIAQVNAWPLLVLWKACIQYHNSSPLSIVSPASGLIFTPSQIDAVDGTPGSEVLWSTAFCQSLAKLVIHPFLSDYKAFIGFIIRYVVACRTGLPLPNGPPTGTTCPILIQVEAALNRGLNGKQLFDLHGQLRQDETRRITMECNVVFVVGRLARTRLSRLALESGVSTHDLDAILRVLDEWRKPGHELWFEPSQRIYDRFFSTVPTDAAPSEDMLQDLHTKSWLHELRRRSAITCGYQGHTEAATPETLEGTASGIEYHGIGDYHGIGEYQESLSSSASGSSVATQSMAGSGAPASHQSHRNSGQGSNRSEAWNDDNDMGSDHTYPVSEQQSGGNPAFTAYVSPVLQSPVPQSPLETSASGSSGGSGSTSGPGSPGSPCSAV